MQLAAGLLDNPTGLHLSRQFFIDKEPPFYTLAEATENVTSAKIYAAFASRSK